MTKKPLYINKFKRSVTCENEKVPLKARQQSPNVKKQRQKQDKTKLKNQNQLNKTTTNKKPNR